MRLVQSTLRVAGVMAKTCDYCSGKRVKRELVLEKMLKFCNI